MKAVDGHSHREYSFAAIAFVAAQQPQVSRSAYRFALAENAAKRSRVLQAEVQPLTGKRMNDVCSIAGECQVRQHHPARTELAEWIGLRSALRREHSQHFLGSYADFAAQRSLV